MPKKTLWKKIHIIEFFFPEDQLRWHMMKPPTTTPVHDTARYQSNLDE